MDEPIKEKKSKIATRVAARRSAMHSRAETEFNQEIVDLARVTRVMAGGKRMRFRACVALGDGRGKVGVGVAKGADVTLAVNKAVAQAKKNLVTVPFIRETIPYEVRLKYNSAVILLKPAPKGTGIKAGGPLRMIFELAGVRNIVGKILGSSNKINNVRAAIEAIRRLRLIEVKPKDDAVKKEASQGKAPAPDHNK